MKLHYSATALGKQSTRSWSGRLGVSGFARRRWFPRPLVHGQRRTRSPPGEKIAFYDCPTDVSEYGAIYVMDADGTGRKKLDATQPTQPLFAWSPDGKKIAYLSTPEGEESADLYVMNADGTDSSLIADNVSNTHLVSWGRR